MIYRNPADSLGSTNISIEHSIFSDYVGYALDVFGSSKAVKSFANRYTGSGKSIRFGSSTSYCSSMSDWFDNVTLASCGTSSPRIDNLSLLNTVFNAQDFVTIPNGIQELHVCGNITVSGSILVTPPAVTSLTLVTVAYPNSNLPQPNSFKGNSIIMDYAMRIPNGGNQILRTGTFKIIYSMSDNTPSATGVAVQYSDDYVEVGGGNSGSGLTLTTQFDNANQNIIIKVTSTIGTPTTKVIINAMSI
jgi:hypothetical protein